MKKILVISAICLIGLSSCGSIKPKKSISSLLIYKLIEKQIPGVIVTNDILKFDGKFYRISELRDIANGSFAYGKNPSISIFQIIQGEDVPLSKEELRKLKQNIKKVLKK